MKKRKRKPMSDTVNCLNCSNCTYACSGSYFCEVSNDLVIKEWTPSDNYFSCNGKDFVGSEKK